MWFLPTYKRPKETQECLDACVASGMTQQGCLFIDYPQDGYENVMVPPNWHIFMPDKHMDMAPSMNWCLERFPDEKFYGWMADDLRPRTPGWDVAISEAAGDWQLSHCEDLWLAEHPGVRKGSLCGAFCWGGKLVRAVGWWGLPGTKQAGTDDAWIRIRDPIFVPQFIVEHLQWRNFKRPKDVVDDHIRDGVDYIAADMAVFDWWANNGGPEEAIGRIAEARDKERNP